MHLEVQNTKVIYFTASWLNCISFAVSQSQLRILRIIATVRDENGDVEGEGGAQPHGVSRVVPHLMMVMMMVMMVRRRGMMSASPLSCPRGGPEQKGFLCCTS